MYSGTINTGSVHVNCESGATHGPNALSFVKSRVELQLNMRMLHLAVTCPLDSLRKSLQYSPGPLVPQAPLLALFNATPLMLLNAFQDHDETNIMLQLCYK